MRRLIFVGLVAGVLGGLLSPAIVTAGVDAVRMIQGGGVASGGTVTSSTLKLNDDISLTCGTDNDYTEGYDNTNTRYELRSTNVDGGGTDGDVLRIEDGTDDVTFVGSIVGIESELLVAAPASAAADNANGIALQVSSSVCWEASPAGTDVCLAIDGTELFVMTGTTGLSIGANPGDAGVLRVENAGAIAWEASPQGTDVTLSVDTSEQVVITGNTGGINFPLRQADLTVGSCTLGELALDTAGTAELCYCQATNVWYCAAITDATGPAD
jgi:hypothetical protein